MIEDHFLFALKHKNPPNHNKDDESYPRALHVHSHIL